MLANSDDPKDGENVHGPKTFQVQAAYDQSNGVGAQTMGVEISGGHLDRENWPNARIIAPHWKSAADPEHMADLP